LCILVVDDNEDAAEMLAAALRLHGCEVMVAHDGPQALNLAAGHSFGAALLDIGLPVMDGYELAVRLRGMASLQDAQMVAITGYGQESDRERALAAGFQQHLVKPVDIAALDALVARLL
ncbi:MAG TPA: response regulator, partial [Steroidobacteraceae bacterium]|nr:response regulator [Steroidobacteraceae bacterium]